MANAKTQMSIEGCRAIIMLKRKYSTNRHLALVIWHSSSVSRQDHLDRVLTYRPGPVGEEFCTRGAVFVGLFHMGMRSGTLFDEIHEAGGGEPAAAALATFQGMFSDHHIADHHRTDIFLVLHADRTCGANIGAGPATDTAIHFRNDKQDAIDLLHLQGAGTDDFLAYAHAQAATHATVGRRSQVHTVGIRHATQPLGLGRHAQQVFKCPYPGGIHHRAGGFDLQPLGHFQDARKHRDRPTGCAATDFHRAKLAGPGRLQGRVVAEGWDVDSVLPGDLKGGLPLIGRVRCAIDNHIDHFISPVPHSEDR
ncbi:hypothetical protein DESC_780407 [Desulfosarcina cetonica]|nr:hypothetical protein DESC_780407 [Desulfosarcina cetonica]